MKRILSVQDLSCLGKCSTTVTLPVLSAMGHACSVLPTALLSAHTGFPEPYVRDLSAEADAIVRHWEKIGAAFDAILIGYLAGSGQFDAANRVLDAFPAQTVLDPAMADGGRLYRGVDEAQIGQYRRLCRRANILLPNTTEAAFLTDMPYLPGGCSDDYAPCLDALRTFGAETVLITGAAANGCAGYVGWDQSAGYFSREVPRRPGAYHGTGDLFTAVFTGYLLSGLSAPEAASRALDFVCAVLDRASAPTPFGLDFEPLLGTLLP